MIAHVGIDPGQSGGIAVLAVRDGLVTQATAHAMPDTDGDVCALLTDILTTATYTAVFVRLEQVHAMPKQGLASTAKFMRHFGMLQGVLQAVMMLAGDKPRQWDLVSPAKWQRALGCLSGGDKAVTKAKAQRLFPELRITHATADALLLAEYDRQLRAGASQEQPCRRRKA